MHQKGPCDVRHPLDVANVRSEDGEGRQDVFQRLVELLAIAEVTKVNECAMQVLFHHLDILLESDVVLNVVLGKSHSDEQRIVELLICPQFVANEVLPGLASHFDGDSLLEGVFEASAPRQVRLGPDLRQPAINPLPEQCLVRRLAKDHLIDFLFEPRAHLICLFNAFDFLGRSSLVLLFIDFLCCFNLLINVLGHFNLLLHLLCFILGSAFTQIVKVNGFSLNIASDHFRACSSSTSLILDPL